MRHPLAVAPLAAGLLLCACCGRAAGGGAEAAAAGGAQRPRERGANLLPASPAGSSIFRDATPEELQGKFNKGHGGLRGAGGPPGAEASPEEGSLFGSAAENAQDALGEKLQQGRSLWRKLINLLEHPTQANANEFFLPILFCACLKLVEAAMSKVSQLFQGIFFSRKNVVGSDLEEEPKKELEVCGGSGLEGLGDVNGIYVRHKDSNEWRILSDIPGATEFFLLRRGEEGWRLLHRKLADDGTSAEQVLYRPPGGSVLFGCWQREVKKDDSLGTAPAVSLPQDAMNCPKCCGARKRQLVTHPEQAIDPRINEPYFLRHKTWKEVDPDVQEIILQTPGSWLRRRWGLPLPLFWALAVSRLAFVHLPQLLINAYLLWLVPVNGGLLERLAWANVLYHTLVYGVGLAVMLLASLVTALVRDSAIFAVLFVLPPHHFFKGLNWVLPLQEEEDRKALQREIVATGWDALAAYQEHPLREVLLSLVHSVFCPDRIFVGSVYVFLLHRFDLESSAHLVDPILLTVCWLAAGALQLKDGVHFWIATVLVLHSFSTISLSALTVHADGVALFEYHKRELLEFYTKFSAFVITADAAILFLAFGPQFRHEVAIFVVPGILVVLMPLCGVCVDWVVFEIRQEGPIFCNCCGCFCAAVGLFLAAALFPGWGWDGWGDFGRVAARVFVCVMLFLITMVLCIVIPAVTFGGGGMCSTCSTCSAAEAEPAEARAEDLRDADAGEAQQPPAADEAPAAAAPAAEPEASPRAEEEGQEKAPLMEKAQPENSAAKGKQGSWLGRKIRALRGCMPGTASSSGAAD